MSLMESTETGDGYSRCCFLCFCCCFTCCLLVSLTRFDKSTNLPQYSIHSISTGSSSSIHPLMPDSKLPKRLSTEWLLLVMLVLWMDDCILIFVQVSDGLFSAVFLTSSSYPSQSVLFRQRRIHQDEARTRAVHTRCNRVTSQLIFSMMLIVNGYLPSHQVHKPFG